MFNSKAIEFFTLHSSFFTLHLLKISVSEETIAIGAQEFLALIERNLAFLHTLGHPLLQLADEFLGVVLHVVENLFHSLTVEDLIDVVLAVLY